MPLRIAFDLDGVLADMESKLERQAESLFGQAARRQPRASASTSSQADAAAPNGGAAAPEPAPDLAPAVARLDLTRRQQSRLWRHIRSIENFWESLDEHEPGVVLRLAALAATRRWEIIFLTRRPETAGATAQVQTQRWLASKGFALPSVYVVQGSRGHIAASLALDIVVDDRPDNCLDVVHASKARAILVWREVEGRPPATMQRRGIEVVESMSVCLDIILRIDAATRGAAGVLSRVRRLLGGKEPASP
jgi:hypothetical protein